MCEANRAMMIAHWINASYSNLNCRGLVTKRAPNVAGGWNDRQPPDVQIHPLFPVGDAVVEVDGYDIEICPVSAILQATVFWALSCTIKEQEQKQEDRQRQAAGGDAGAAL